MEITREFLEKMPKSDLHVHLDGSLRLSTILELADQQGVKLPGGAADEESLARAIHMGEICEDLNDYLTAFDVTLSVLQTEEALYRAAFELGEDMARENVRYTEVRYSPLLHTQRGLSYPVIVEAVAEGLREAKRRYGLMSGQIICGIRHITPEASLRMAELAVAFKHRGVVGFDLAGGEADNPPKDHKDAFYLVRNNNVNLTIHAGEAFGPESIHQAIHVCGAHRIGHGTRLREDGDLLNFVNDHRVPLEICLSSNVQTRACESYESHPLPFYLSYGLRMCLNTDNRLVTDTTMTDEFWKAVQYFDLGIGDLRKLIVDGFKSSFMPQRKKRTVTAKAVEEFDRLVEKFARAQGKQVEERRSHIAQEIMTEGRRLEPTMLGFEPSEASEAEDTSENPDSTSEGALGGARSKQADDEPPSDPPTTELHDVEAHQLPPSSSLGDISDAINAALEESGAEVDEAAQ